MEIDLNLFGLLLFIGFVLGFVLRIKESFRLREMSFLYGIYFLVEGEK